MAFESSHHGDVVAFLEDLSPLKRNASDRFIYRGHRDAGWALLPTALRTLPGETNSWLLRWAGVSAASSYSPRLIQAQAEFRLLSYFYAEADRAGLAVPTEPSILRQAATSIDNSFNWKLDHFSQFEARKWLSHSVTELAALAQHHGIPTRLLDWSYDHRTAAYFAARGWLEFYEAQPKLAASDLCVWELRITDWASTQVELVRPAYAGNPNLRAQQGVFTHVPEEIPASDDKAEVEARPLDTILDPSIDNDPAEYRLRKLVLKGSAAYDLRDRLDQLGVNASSLFPGYRGAATTLVERRAWASTRRFTEFGT